jgi:small subunit ribosomal protein S6
MRHYENLVIVKPTLTEEEIKNTIALVEEVITANGGEIVARDAMGMKKLAYPIEKNVRGYFYVMYYKAAPAAIAEIERRFRINEEILRFVTMKYDSKREIAAWNGMVDKTKKTAPVAAVAEKKEEAAS